MYTIKHVNICTDLPKKNSRFVELNINIKKYGYGFDYFNRNKYREYKSKYGYVFNNVLEGNTVVWKATCTFDFAQYVLVYEGDEKYILIIPFNGNLILFRQLKDNTWERINTEINLNKLKLYYHEVYTDLPFLNSESKLVESVDKLRDMEIFDHYYYDLDKHNFKIVFNTFCHVISYEEKEIWKQTKDNAHHGNPNYINFDLISGDVTINFIDGTVETLYINRPSHKRSRAEVESVNQLNENSEPKNENVEDKSVPPEVITLDTDTMMSTNKYKTFRSPVYRHFKANNGFVFGKIVDDGKVILDTDDPSKYVTEYKCPTEFDWKILKLTDYFESIRPNVDKLKLYNKNGMELHPDDYFEVSSKYYYSIIFNKKLYKIMYDGKVCWKYNYYKNECFPHRLYFSYMDTNMTMSFAQVLEKQIKISCNLLKMYKHCENNKMEMEDEDYEVMKLEYDQRLYTLKDDIKCVEVWYDDCIVWEHISGKEYPKSICCHYKTGRVVIRYDSYLASFERLGFQNYFTWYRYLPKDLKLYKSDKNGNSVELSPNDYRIDLSCPSTIEYILKPVKCNEIRLGDSAVWKRQNKKPFPRKIVYLAVRPTISVYSKRKRFRNCYQTKLIQFTKYNGVWRRYQPICSKITRN